MKILYRLLDVLVLVAKQPRLQDLVNELSRKWKVTKQTVYYHIDRLIESKIIKIKKVGKEKYVDFTTEFLLLVDTISNMIYERKDYYDRVRKLIERMKKHSGIH